MLSRALSLATVLLLVGCFAAIPAQAQNLEAGKSPSQIFAGTCSLCHKSSRGLLKTVPAGSLPGFLREHYTTSSDMASLLSAFLISNGANDTRYVGSQPKQGKDAKPEANPVGLSEQFDRPGRRSRSGAVPQEDFRPDVGLREPARPDDADGLSPQRQGRNAKRPARPGEVPDTSNVSERDLDGPKSAKQKQSKRGKPGGEETPKADAAKTDAAKTDAAKTEPSRDEPLKGEAVKDEQPKNEAAKDEGSKTEGSKPSGEGKSEAAKTDVPKESGSAGAPALRADPVPPVTPAPPASPAASNGISGPAAAAPSAPMAPSAPPAVTASAPQPAPVAPAGPPVPPISQ